MPDRELKKNKPEALKQKRKSKNMKFNGRLADSGTNKAKVNEEDLERRNRLIMWVGITAIMAVIIIVWLFNLKNEFSVRGESGLADVINWDQIKSASAPMIDQLEQGLAQINKLSENISSSTPKEEAMSDEQIKTLKEKLINEVASTTSASSTVEN